MKPIRLVLALLALSACGEGRILGPDDPLTITSPSGIFRVHARTYSPAVAEHGYLADLYWQQVQTCVGRTARVRDIDIYLMRGEMSNIFPEGRPAFICPYLGGQWVGGCLVNHHAAYVLGAVMENPAWAESWRHELIHLLLWESSGRKIDTDADHGTPPRGIWLCQAQ